MHGDACMSHSAMLLPQCVPAASMSQPQTGLGVTGVTQTTSAQGGTKQRCLSAEAPGSAADQTWSPGTLGRARRSIVVRPALAATAVTASLQLHSPVEWMWVHPQGCLGNAIRVDSSTAAAAACDRMIWKHDRTSSCCGEFLIAARFSCGRAHCDPQP